MKKKVRVFWAHSKPKSCKEEGILVHVCLWLSVQRPTLQCTLFTKLTYGMCVSVCLSVSVSLSVYLFIYHNSFGNIVFYITRMRGISFGWYSLDFFISVIFDRQALFRSYGIIYIRRCPLVLLQRPSARFLVDTAFCTCGKG